MPSKATPAANEWTAEEVGRGWRVWKEGSVGFITETRGINAEKAAKRLEKLLNDNEPPAPEAWDGPAKDPLDSPAEP